MQKEFITGLGEDKISVTKAPPEEPRNPNPWMNKSIHFGGFAEDSEMADYQDQNSVSEFRMSRSNKSTGSNNSNLDKE